MAENDPTRLVREHARDVDRLLGYLKRETERYVADSRRESKDWGYPGSLGHLREQLITATASISGSDGKSIDDIIGQETIHVEQIKTPKRLPAGYRRDQMREDLLELHRNIDARVIDGYSYLIEPDYEMAGTMFTDVADLQHASELIQQGDYGRAGTSIAGLDTAVRDEIPRRLYGFLYPV